MVKPGESSESSTYVNRLLVFIFATPESFEQSLRLPKQPFKMACGDQLCVNLHHILLDAEELNEEQEQEQEEVKEFEKKETKETKEAEVKEETKEAEIKEVKEVKEEVEIEIKEETEPEINTENK